MYQVVGLYFEGHGCSWALGGVQAVAATAWFVRQPFGGVEALGGGSPGGASAVLAARQRPRRSACAPIYGAAARFVGHAVAHTRHMREACGFPLSGQPCGPRGDPRGCLGRREHGGGRVPSPKPKTLSQLWASRYSAAPAVGLS